MPARPIARPCYRAGLARLSLDDEVKVEAEEILSPAAVKEITTAPQAQEQESEVAAVEAEAADIGSVLKSAPLLLFVGLNVFAMVAPGALPWQQGGESSLFELSL